MKNDQVKTKIEVNSVKQNQVDMSSDITNLQKDNNCLSELNDQMQLDIDFLHDTVDAKTVTIEKLEDDIDRLEVRARSDMMRIFGLPILPDESDENIGQHIVQNVLKVACPGVTWECDDLKRAFRVGGEAENQPPVVIVRFRYDDDKSKIFAGRDELRRHGIRVANDLTLRQREKLKALKDKGKIGYFYKGKLVERPKRFPEVDIASRVYRRAARRIDPVEQANENEANEVNETANELNENSDDMSVENDGDRLLTADEENNGNGL